MATSPNYGWLEPDNTDLVKNGALSIRTLGNAIDTTMATMTPKSTYTAKGSIAAATAASTPANLTVGSNYSFLQADSAQTTGLLWNNAAWTSYTPTITSQNGTITTSSGEGYYTRVGKMCAIYVRANVITAGTGNGYLRVTVPFTARGIIEQIGVGRETAANGKALTAKIAASDNAMEIIYYDAAGATVSGTRNIISMVYEVA